MPCLSWVLGPPSPLHQYRFLVAASIHLALRGPLSCSHLPPPPRLPHPVLPPPRQFNQFFAVVVADGVNLSDKELIEKVYRKGEGTAPLPSAWRRSNAMQVSDGVFSHHAGCQGHPLQAETGIAPAHDSFLIKFETGGWLPARDCTYDLASGKKEAKAANTTIMYGGSKETAQRAVESDRSRRDRAGGAGGSRVARAASGIDTSGDVLPLARVSALLAMQGAPSQPAQRRGGDAPPPRPVDGGDACEGEVAAVRSAVGAVAGTSRGVTVSGARASNAARPTKPANAPALAPGAWGWRSDDPLYV